MTTSSGPAARVPESFQCGWMPPEFWASELRAAVDRGEIADPSTRALPSYAPGAARPLHFGPRRAPDPNPPLTVADVHPFEDTSGVMLTNYSVGELLDFLALAYNSLISTHGDNFDFASITFNFEPDHVVAGAFYNYFVNDVQGIGDTIYDLKKERGIIGENLQGANVMHNIAGWEGGSGTALADWTRLVLGQEFSHRWMMLLPDLADGRMLQGEPGCGRIAHWNWRVDGQGSSMELSEWTGSLPATLAQSFATFNNDIPGGLFGYPDLYLMGYVSPAEMDAGVSERYMDNETPCAGIYTGPVSTFTSADIIATAGPRIPDNTQAPQHFRTGWVMVHQPDDPPTVAQKQLAVSIMQQHQVAARHVRRRRAPDPVARPGRPRTSGGEGGLRLSTRDDARRRDHEDPAGPLSASQFSRSRSARARSPTSPTRAASVSRSESASALRSAPRYAR